MSANWTSIQTPFHYQRGNWGWFRAKLLPNFLGGINNEQYDYATQIWNLAKDKKESGSEYDFSGFAELLSIRDDLKEKSPFFELKHRFITQLFKESEFNHSHLCHETLANHWSLFTTHLEKDIKEKLKETDILFRLNFSQAVKRRLGRQALPYFFNELIPSNTLKDIFTNGEYNLDEETLDFIFNHLYRIDSLMNIEMLSKLVDAAEDHPLAVRLSSRYARASVKGETGHFAIVSQLHYYKSQTLKLSLLQRIIQFFKPGASPVTTPALTTATDSPILSPLSEDTILENFIDRVIELGEAKPSKEECQLFNEYRLAHAPSDPYYYLIANSLGLTPLEKPDVNWLSFQKENCSKLDELPPPIKASLFQTIKKEISAIINEKVSTDQYGLSDAGVPTRDCDRFGQAFKRLFRGAAKADSIRSFIGFITMKGESAYYKIAGLEKDHPLVRDLERLKTAAEWLENDHTIRSYETRQSQAAHAHGFFMGQAILKMVQFKRTIQDGKPIYMNNIDKAAGAGRGEIDGRIKSFFLSEIRKLGGDIIETKSKRGEVNHSALRA